MLSPIGIGAIASSGGAASLLPFTDDFTRANGELGNDWEYSAGVWTVSGNAATANPATTGGELITNGAFSAWTGDNPDGWTVFGESGTDPEVSEVGSGEGHGGTGSGMCNIYSSAGADVRIEQAISTTRGRFYRGTVDLNTVTSGRLYFTDTGNGFCLPNLNAVGSRVFGGINQNNTLRISRQSGATNITIDNVSLQQLVTADCMATRDVGVSDVVIDLGITIAANDDSSVGVVACLDDKDNPQNYVVAVIGRTFPACQFYKVVGGAATRISSQSITYSAGATLRITKNGTTFQVWYNGTQVDGDHTISDAGIISNTRHGMANTYNGNSLDNFSISPFS